MIYMTNNEENLASNILIYFKRIRIIVSPELSFAQVVCTVERQLA
jgi:hypothetical protein